MKTAFFARILLILLAIISFQQESKAQVFPTENYIFNKVAASPAYAGYNGNIESFVNYSKYWSGISGAPRFTGLNFHLPAFYQGGIMASLSDYQTGNFSFLNVDLAYAQHFELSNDIKFGFALRPEYYRNQIELSQIKSQGSDPKLSTVSSLQTGFFDIGAGAVFSYKNYIHGGFSARAMSAKSGKYQNTDLVYSQSSTYDFNLNGEYQIDKYFEARLSYYTIFKPKENVKFTHQIAGMISYKRKVLGALIFRTRGHIGITAGGIISDNILLSYNYGFSFSDIEAVSGGSHNIALGFLIKRNTINQVTDVFPVSEQQQLLIENEDELKALRRETEKVKRHLNRVVSSYDRRFSELEEEDIIKDRSRSGNRKNLNFEEPLSLPTIAFAEHGGRLLACSQSDLNRLVNMMVRDARMILRITVQVRNIGTERVSYELARRRTRSIKDYLKTKGVNTRRVITDVRLSDKNKVWVEVSR